MRNLKIALVAAIGLPLILWSLADTLYSSPFDYKQFRDAAIQLTGIVAIVAMSVAAVLAARPRLVEGFFNGLDKMYLLHKWLGITALVGSVLHWWLTSGSHMFSSGGEGGRPPRPEGAADQAASLFETLKGPAHPVGEWAFYAFVVLVLIALVNRIPYKWFAKSHLLMMPVLLALVFHSTLLAETAYWAQPIGWLLAMTLIACTLSVLVSLARELGLTPMSKGTVTRQHYYPELKVLETEIEVDGSWKGHAAGQFAFVSTRRFEGAHPFTIASAWDENARKIVFIAKQLGDYTAKLREEFAPGHVVTLEGPYGRFNFEDGKATQIWIGAGVGITPFIARMKYLAGRDHGQTIHLFHSTTEVSDEALQKMAEDAAAAQITLHITRSRLDPLLNGEAIRAAVPDWKNAGVWFCGPAGFGTAIRADLVGKGLAPADFHRERFAMR